MIKLTLYSHGCLIKASAVNEVAAIKEFVGGRLVQSESHFNNQTKRMDHSIKAVFASRTSDNKEIRILREDVPALLRYLDKSGFSRFVKQTELPVPKYESIQLKMKPSFQPRTEEQSEAIKFAMDDQPSVRVIQAATGFGKTFCGFYIACLKNRRTLFTMEASYIEIWVGKIKEYIGDDAMKRVLVVKGSENLTAMMDLASAGHFPYDFIFISSTTYRNYITAYEDRDNHFNYPVKPQDLIGHLKVGLMIRDEAHEAIHALCKQLMYTNIAQTIFLSATLVDDDPFIKNIYTRIFPDKDMWISQPNKYTVITSYFYDSDRQANLTGFGPRGYSHISLEKQYMKYPKLLNQFWYMLADLINQTFVEHYEKGLKCIIFVSTVKMADQLKKRAEKEWPHLTIGRYTSKDSEEELYERDIVFSTPGSAGTGKDIRNLEYCWNTVAMSSTKLQRQIMGRPRKVEDFDRDSHYCLLFNQSIKQHKAYEKKLSLGTIGRCKKYERKYLPNFIKGDERTAFRGTSQNRGFYRNNSFSPFKKKRFSTQATYKPFSSWSKKK